MTTDRIKFEVGKTYKIQNGEPRTVVHVDKEGWGYFAKDNPDSRSTSFCQMAPHPCWKEYIPPRTKDVWVWAYVVVNGYGNIEWHHGSSDKYETAVAPVYGKNMCFIKKITLTEGEIEPPTAEQS